MDRDERALRALLAANVARVRRAQELTVEAAAERVDIDPRQWRRVEGGDANATLRTLARISRSLGVAVALLFWFREPARPSAAERRSRRSSRTCASSRSKGAVR